MVTHTFSRTDGQGRVNLEVARHLAEAGHEVTLISTAVDPPLAALPGVAWRAVPIPSWLRGALFRYQVFALGARRAIRREPSGFDIVHLNGFIAYHPADVNASHFVHADWLKSPHHVSRVARGADAAYQWSVTVLNVGWERRAYRVARRVVAVSEAVRDSLADDVGIDTAKIEVIPNGVDTAEFRPLAPGETNALRAELGLSGGTFVAFFAGDIRTNRKNLDLALHSVGRLGPGFHLAVAGGAAGSPYPAMARDLKIADRVHFLGHRADVPALLRGANALAFASHYDPYALVIPEAMASGVPVVTAPSVGASSLIRQGENGFVLRDSSDLEGMTAALQHLAADPSSAARIGAAGRALAETLSWGAMARRYEALYQEVLAEKHRAARGRRLRDVRGAEG